MTTTEGNKPAEQTGGTKLYEPGMHMTNYYKVRNVEAWRAKGGEMPEPSAMATLLVDNHETRVRQ